MHSKIQKSAVSLRKKPLTHSGAFFILILNKKERTAYQHTMAMLEKFLQNNLLN